MDVGAMVTSAGQRSQSALAVANSFKKTEGVRSSATTRGGSSTTTNTDTSEITASDFMTLLVTEMKNQDPTQPTDPNEYVQQLVGVNSLQQLIQINNGMQSLTGSVSGATTT